MCEQMNGGVGGWGVIKWIKWRVLLVIREKVIRGR